MHRRKSRAPSMQRMRACAAAGAARSNGWMPISPVTNNAHHGVIAEALMPIAKQKITPCLWFDTQAEQAANFYTAIFKNSRITKVSRYTEAGRDIHGKEAGSVLTVEFELQGQTFTALNGGPHFKFNEAVPVQVMCEGQTEVEFVLEPAALAFLADVAEFLPEIVHPGLALEHHLKRDSFVELKMRSAVKRGEGLTLQFELDGQH